MKALIIANGDQLDRRLVRKLSASADMVVCADGGANAARAYGIHPDVILGDLDSISSSTKKIFKHIPLLFMDDQYSTDLEKAITYCIERGAGSVSIVGAIGSRIDHSTGSLGCFKKFGSRIEITMYDREGSVVLLHNNKRFTTVRGEKISLIPLERCTGVTAKNLFYSLKNDVLELGVREGISNFATASTISVTCKRGTLLLYRFHHRS